MVAEGNEEVKLEVGSMLARLEGCNMMVIVIGFG